MSTRTLVIVLGVFVVGAVIALCYLDWYATALILEAMDETR